MVRVDLRTVVLDVPTQDVITRDNVSVKVNAVLYFRVVDPEKAIIQVENFLEATSQLAQTTLRAVLGKHELDELLAEREQLNLDIQKILDAQTDAWGIKVTNVEIKHVDLNETMVRAIARQAEAERERRAKVIHAEGELQAVGEAGRGGRDPRAASRGDAAALPADADDDRRRQELDHRVPAADRHHRAAAAAAGRRGRGPTPDAVVSAAVRGAWQDHSVIHCPGPRHAHQLRRLRGRHQARRHSGRRDQRLPRAARLLRVGRAARCDRRRAGRDCSAEFGLHPLAVEDAQHGHQRPKVEEYGDSLFAVHAPAGARAAGPGELQRRRGRRLRRPQLRGVGAQPQRARLRRRPRALRARARTAAARARASCSTR